MHTNARIDYSPYVNEKKHYFTPLFLTKTLFFGHPLTFAEGGERGLFPLPPDLLGEAARSAHTVFRWPQNPGRQFTLSVIITLSRVQSIRGLFERLT